MSGLLCVWLTASIGADSSPAAVDEAHLFRQLVDDSLGVDTDAKRAMSMLRMGRGEAEQAVKKAMGMLRMGRSSSAVDAGSADKRAMGMLRMGRSYYADNSDSSKRAKPMGMLRMGRAMGMLRMGRPSVAETSANYNDKRGMPMLRMGWSVKIPAEFIVSTSSMSSCMTLRNEQYSNMTVLFLR